MVCPKLTWHVLSWKVPVLVRLYFRQQMQPDGTLLSQGQTVS